MADKTVYVYADWAGGRPVLAGRLYTDSLRGRETCAFEYADAWLAGQDPALPLDPDLQWYAGRQFAPPDKSMFGAFSDSCPDRWGRTLLRRWEAVRAATERRAPRQLTETDYLLAVPDQTRMGALRFSLQPDGPFLADGSEDAAPPWSALRSLEGASLRFEREEDAPGACLRQLLMPCVSLGGARPKAVVRAADGALWIAKFPAANDVQNTEAWEWVIHELARACGLNVPESRLERLSDAGSTLLVKRFDRAGARRVHFASALALLGKTDGASAQDGCSYLDLADFILSHGASPEEDLKELWKRIVFSMAVSNTDDHLRNHGFLRTDGGWRLSPLYDVNPVPGEKKLSLNVTEDNAAIDPEVALEAAPFFGLEKDEAAAAARSVFAAVGSMWRPAAEKCGIPRQEQAAMSPAFALCRRSPH